MTTHTAVILAAGMGTRMKSSLPKVLHKVCGKEMIRIVAETARSVGLDPVVAVVPKDSGPIRSALGDLVLYATQTEPNGSGDALAQARDTLIDAASVVVLSGDVPMVKAETIEKMLAIHNEREACITLMTSRLTSPDGLGRIVRSYEGRITEIVEQRDADADVLAINEINGGVYCFRAPWLWKNIDKLRPAEIGEVYLTGLISLAVKQNMIVESVESTDRWEPLGVDTRLRLAEAETAMQERIRTRWLLEGVTMQDPSSVYIDADVVIGMDTVLLPNSHLEGWTKIGKNCVIGPDTTIANSAIAAGCTVQRSTVEGAILDEMVNVGPYSHIRPDSRLMKGVHIGNFGEVKNSTLGPDTRSGHFSYIGDAELGKDVNVGAGTITCNYDGENKTRTEVGDNVFIGSDSLLIAPVTLESNSATGAGAIVNRKVPEDHMWVGDRANARVVRKRARRSKEK